MFPKVCDFPVYLIPLTYFQTSVEGQSLKPTKSVGRVHKSREREFTYFEDNIILNEKKNARGWGDPCSRRLSSRFSITLF
jgi:hypothetical protein